MLLVDYQGPDIDAIGIIALQMPSIEELQDDSREQSDLLHTGTHWRFRMLRQNLCRDEQVMQVGKLWNALPSGQAARCHLPGFALQFLARDEIAFSAALCWQCNTISFAGDHAPHHRTTFDGTSPEAIELLHICKAVTELA